MHIRTITSVATLLAVTAVGFAGCAAEETTDSPTGNAANGNGNQVTATTNPNTTNVASAGNTTTVNSAAVNTAAGNTTGASTTGAAAGPTTTGAAVTNTVAGAAAVTSGGTPAAAANTVAGAANNTTGGGASCDAPPAAGTAPIIDDFEDNDHIISPNEGRLGYWYEYGDADGTQMTAPLDGVDGMGGVLTSEGSGFTEYVGFGVDLNNDNANQEPCEYDASVHTGIQFDITSDTDVLFQVALPTTVGDSDHYGIAVPASATKSTFKAAFADLAQGGWGDAATWDPSAILQLQWQIADPTAAFNITLDNVAFY